MKPDQIVMEYILKIYKESTPENFRENLVSNRGDLTDVKYIAVQAWMSDLRSTRLYDQVEKIAP